MPRLAGKVALVTGAARGQGRSHALTLAEEGADIIAIDLCGPLKTVPYPLPGPSDLEETKRQVEALDRRCFAAIADVRDLAGLTAATDEGVAALGRLDIAICNAGICTIEDVPGSLTEEQWDETIDINLSGVWKTLKATVPHVKAVGPGGSIITVSSVLGLKAYTNMPHYVASKHGVVGLTKAYARELAPQMIRVNCICPTNTDTNMIHFEEMYRRWLPELENPTRDDFAGPMASVNEMPLPWVEPRDTSRAVLFLATDDSRYITGLVLPVDLGSMLQ